MVEDEPSEEIVERQIVTNRNRSQERTPQPDTSIENPQVEIEQNDFRPPTVRFGTQKEIILPPPCNECRIRVPLREEPHESNSQPTQTRTEDEERMSSRPSRNNQSRYKKRENPTPKTYPDFLIHEITTARNALRKSKNVNVTI